MKWKEKENGTDERKGRGKENKQEKKVKEEIVQGKKCNHGGKAKAENIEKKGKRERKKKKKKKKSIRRKRQ